MGSLCRAKGRQDLSRTFWRVGARRSGAEESGVQSQQRGETRARFIVVSIRLSASVLEYATLSSTYLQGENMADVSIRPKPNGPYLIDGPVDVYDTAGNKIPTDDRPRIALCRCGASSNKPFCDGTHSKIGFQAAETINPESAE